MRLFVSKNLAVYIVMCLIMLTTAQKAETKISTNREKNITGFTTSQLIEECNLYIQETTDESDGRVSVKANKDGLDKAMKLSHCTGYIEGLIDGNSFTTENSFCIPTETTTRQIAKFFIEETFDSSHLQMSAAAILTKVLRQKYPCAP